jgi:hypothetical protein
LGEEYHRQQMVLGQVSNLGPVILYDDMEGLLKWGFSGTDTEIADLSATVAYNGSKSIHMATDATPAGAGEYVEGHRLTYQRPGKRYAAELIWRCTDMAKVLHFRLQISIYDGTTEHIISLDYLGPEAKWQYNGAAGAPVDVPGGAQALVNLGWHRLEMQYDEALGQHIKMVSDGLEIDMSGIAYYTAASATGSQQQIKIEIMAVTMEQAEGWFDDVLIREI